VDEQEFLNSQKRQREHYNLSLDDENNLLGQFPDKKYFEFLYHCWLNEYHDEPDLLWKEWSPWQVWSYPIHDLIRYKTMLLDNSDLIKGARIADIGSHLGIGVLFSLHMGAELCVGIEPIEAKNKLASFVCRQAGFNNFEFITGELKQEQIFEKINDFDTLILGGLMDMIPDHYRLIDNISKTQIKNIIIEVGEHEQHCRSDIPNIVWRHFEKDKIGHGPYNPAVNNAIHGFPNLSFLKMLMGEFGYEFQKQDFFDVIKTDTGKPRLRSVSVFKNCRKGRLTPTGRMLI